jgi:hypothetical protein
MNLTGIANLRLVSQQIAARKIINTKEIVGWMGGMQAQDYAMAKWAIGLRLPNSTDQEVETAINNGEIIRTHVLRPTWHFVSADDLYWLLELTAHQIKASLRSRHKQLGLSEPILKKSNKIMENALRGGKHLIREELLGELGKAKIALTENRASHLLVWAELDGIVCSGATREGKQTYALLDERVPKKKSKNEEEALAKLANTYFTSRGPATLKDFVWWSGLPVSKAKHALEIIRSELSSEEVESQTYWFKDFDSIPRIDQEVAYLLPAYDEFLISYEDRSVSLPYEDRKKTVSNNGIFRPIILVNGQVTGIWKRTIKKDKVIIETEFFKQPGLNTKNMVEKALIQYGNYLDKQIEISHK